MRMRDFYRFQILYTEGGSLIDPSGGTERGDIRVDYRNINTMQGFSLSTRTHTQNNLKEWF